MINYLERSGVEIGFFMVQGEDRRWRQGERYISSSIHRDLKNKSNHRCDNCGNWFVDRDFMSLEVHHIDRDPHNDTIENLVVLCKKCHRVRHTRKEWRHDC
jgi:5-methylcytosine-specific restriction endonuclease McrA